MADPRIITVNSRKFDGSINRTWECELVSATKEEIQLEGIFDRDVEHPDLGRISAGTVSEEFFWIDRWYNVFRFHEPTGELRNYYCNVCTPAALKGNVLEYVDLDIDVIVWPDGTSKILDEDEFEQNSLAYRYPAEVLTRVKQSLDELVDMVTHPGFRLPRLTD